MKKRMRAVEDTFRKSGKSVVEAFRDRKRFIELFVLVESLRFLEFLNVWLLRFLCATCARKKKERE